MSKTAELLGDQAEYLLAHTCRTIPREMIHIPSPDTVETIWAPSDRNAQTLRSLQSLLGHGRLAGTGYLSILPVDQGIEHSAGASFAPTPAYFDPEQIVRLAIEGGCNAVASTFGVLGSVARRYAHKIPFVVKINHNELLSYPNAYDQILFGTVEEAWRMGAVAVGATIYFGSAESRRQLVEIARAFARAHELGMATILWCCLLYTSHPQPDRRGRAHDGERHAHLRPHADRRVQGEPQGAARDGQGVERPVLPVPRTEIHPAADAEKAPERRRGHGALLRAGGRLPQRNDQGLSLIHIWPRSRCRGRSRNGSITRSR